MCPNRDQLDAYYDGELTPGQRAEFEAHLHACPECRQVLADMQSLSRALHEVALPEMPARAMSRFHGSWHMARQERERGVRRLASWMTAAAAAVLVLVMVRSPDQRSEVAEVNNTGTAWVETVAFMPPVEHREGNSAELVQIAQWMASDLSTGSMQQQ